MFGKRRKQEIYNISVPATHRPSLNAVKGIKKYKKVNGKWETNKELERLKGLPDAKIKKVAEYEIEDNA